jgi:hypothetical protein
MRVQTLKNPKPISRIRPWGILIVSCFLLWVFAFKIGPWIQESIPTFKQIVEVIEERDIDSTAYFYTGIEASYDGEQYLRESLEFSAPDEAGLTIPFLLGLFLCGIILWIGYRFLPND